MLDILKKQLKICSNKMKYIQELLDETLDLRKKSKTTIVELLVSKDYDMIDDDSDYKYLLKMPMDSVSEENVERLNGEFQDKQKKYAELESTSAEDMWMRELDVLNSEYDKFINNHRKNIENENSGKPSKKKSKSKN
jgi:DNA topoisomerase-2